MSIRRSIVVGVLVSMGLFLAALSHSHLPRDSHSQAVGQRYVRTTAAVPAYHTDAPLLRDLPATLAPQQFVDPLARLTYGMAAKIKPILYQLPCYCYCDRYAGHKSLLDCFVSSHSANCAVCEKECIYAYEGALHGEDVTQIRSGIFKGEWEKIDLDEYRTKGGF
jgi:hypothetical protein